MNSHPGGKEQTKLLVELAEKAGLKDGGWVIDLGAGDGSSVELLRAMGYQAVGIDREPRGICTAFGDIHASGKSDESFDAALSECAFFASGDPAAAFKEAARILRRGGLLMYSDVVFEDLDPEDTARAAGFVLLHREELTQLWREYYFKALWTDECGCSELSGLPKGKGSCRYFSYIFRKA